MTFAELDQLAAQTGALILHRFQLDLRSSITFVDDDGDCGQYCAALDGLHVGMFDSDVAAALAVMNVDMAARLGLLPMPGPSGITR